MGRRPFEKFQGLGNDFLVVDAERWPEAMMTPALARALCDRHLGVGGDGVLWVQRLHGFDGASPQGDRRAVRLVIWNADGTRPEMCGNGVRCVVDWLAHQGTLLEGETVAVHTDAGVRAATLLHHGANGSRVAVEMGAIRLGPNEIVRVNDDAVEVTPVDVGNPHGVVFAPRGAVMDTVDAVRALAVFPHGVNVELVDEEAGALRVRVNERSLAWADVVFVMEARHREQLRERFGAAARAREVVVLDIPDAWTADDPELVAMLDRRVREELSLRGLWPDEAP